MIIYHKHHIIPRHMGGTDDPSNLIELTIEEHAESHRKLYEEHGKREDYIAWKMLMGQMKMGDLWKEKAKLGGLATAGKPRNRIAPAHNKIDFYCIGCRNKDKPYNINTGKGHTLCFRERQSPPNKKYFHCIGCRQEVSPSKIMWHASCYKEYVKTHL